MGGKNPCDCCRVEEEGGHCGSCVLNTLSIENCSNTSCFCNYEMGCLLGLDEDCKASDCYRGRGK